MSNRAWISLRMKQNRPSQRVYTRVIAQNTNQYTSFNSTSTLIYFGSGSERSVDLRRPVLGVRPMLVD
jgi:hypothetical protein